MELFYFMEPSDIQTPTLRSSAGGLQKQLQEPGLKPQETLSWVTQELNLPAPLQMELSFLKQWLLNKKLYNLEESQAW